MSQSKVKKLKQMYSREIRKQASQKIAEWNQIILPKPKWWPMFFYKWVLKKVIR